MRILYVAHRYDYGLPRLGFSFEHQTFFDALHRMGHTLIYVDLGATARTLGQAGASAHLVEVARHENPDVLFSVLFRDEIDPTAIGMIGTELGIPTVNWYTDDHWRFETFSTVFTPYFTWVVTTARSALPKYKAHGWSNVIKSQWACNHFQYHPRGLPTVRDVAFVGLPHGNRRVVVRQLRRSGFEVSVWGRGWAGGRIPQSRMLAVFEQTRINLNMSNPSVASPLPARGAAALVRLLEGSRLPGRLRDAIAERLVGMVFSVEPGAAGQSQVKGRTFEIPGCGGFLLTDAAEDLESFYVPGQEIAVYSDFRSLREQIRSYLSSPVERERVAAAGYARTLRDHTYVHRFSDIFTRVGLAADAPEDILARRIAPGPVIEVAP